MSNGELNLFELFSWSWCFEIGIFFQERFARGLSFFSVPNCLFLCAISKSISSPAGSRLCGILNLKGAGFFTFSDSSISAIGGSTDFDASWGSIGDIVDAVVSEASASFGMTGVRFIEGGAAGCYSAVLEAASRLTAFSFYNTSLAA